MRFYWYQATFAEKSPKGILEALQAAYGPGSGISPCAPLYGYGEGYAVVHDDLVRARVLADGYDVHEIRKKYVHAWATSDDTDAFVDCVRNEWPDVSPKSTILAVAHALYSASGAASLNSAI